MSAQAKNRSRMIRGTATHWELIMIEIVLSVCMLADPGRCKDVHLTYMAEAQAITPHSCMMYGQSEIAKWTEGNPNWAIQRWTCGVPRALAKA